MSDVTVSGPPTPGADSPTLSEVLTALQALLAAAKISAAAAAASAGAAAASATEAANVPALTTVFGAPVQSVFGRISDVVAVANDYSFSQISGAVDPTQMPALSGAVTSSPGSTATVLTNIPSDTPLLGDLLVTNMVAPGTPSSGETRLYVDSTGKNVSAKNDTGAILAMAKVGGITAGLFVNGLNADGSFKTGTPGAGDFSGITGTATVGQMPASVVAMALEFTINGGGSPMLAGLAQGWLVVPCNCTIQSVTLLGDQSGSVTIDILRCTYANFSPGTHPVAGDSICASDVPNINSAKKSTDSTLTGWNKTLAAGDVLAFNTKSPGAVNITYCTVVLLVTKT